ncbi:MAG: biotin/lipoyl-binding protein [Pseudomonadota bacterium]
MKRRKSDIIYEGIPRLRIRHMPFIWLFWAVATVFMMIGAASWLSLSIEVEDHRIYPGSLSEKQEPFHFDLPAGAILQRVEVSEGQLVQAGQTIFTLDVDAMRQRRSQLTKEREANSYLLDCLLSINSKETNFEANAETSAHLTEAEDQCVVSDFRSNREIAILKRQVKFLLEESSLLEKFSRFLVRPEANPETETVKKVVGLSLARNRIDQAVLDLTLRIQIIIDQANVLRAQKVSEALQTAKQIDFEIKRLDKFLQDPRVSIRSDAHISRIRNYTSKVPREADTPILEIFKVHEIRFAASFFIPVSDREDFEIGTEVVLTVTGTSDEILSLRGHISDIQVVGTDDLKLNVYLDSAAHGALAKNSLTRSLNGPTTTVDIMVSKALKPLHSDLIRVFNGIFSPIRRSIGRI